MTEADRIALYRQMDDKLLVGHVGESEEVAEAFSISCVRPTGRARR